MVTEKMRAQMACKAAIKAGDTLSNEKMTKLLHDLEKQPTDFLVHMDVQPAGFLDILTIEKNLNVKYDYLLFIFINHYIYKHH